MHRIIDALKEKGIESYFVGQKVGDCKNKYVVVKDGGTSGENGSNVNGTQLVDIIFFVPINTPSKSAQFKKEVKNILKEIKFIDYTGVETPTVVDDSKKAITFSVLYKIYKKLEG